MREPDELTGFGEITERERRPASPPRGAYEVLWTAVRDQHRSEEALRAAGRETERRDKQLADDLVVVLHKMREFGRGTGPAMVEAGLGPAADLVASLTERIAAALERRGATVVDPVGRDYPEVAHLVEVLGDDGTGRPAAEMSVTRTEQAGLIWPDGELVRPATVRLGAAEGATADGTENDGGTR